jgi:uncharacterized membrane protein
MELFSQDGFFGAFRVAHVFAAIMWMGLLWFFNFVQTPAFAEMDAAARNDALDKLTWRALWWFRWAAIATVVMGILLIGAGVDSDTHTYDGTYFFKTAPGVNLLLGIIMGLVMAANVWMVIWPNQQIVIANARNVKAGGEANPDAAAAGRAGAMASRQNTIFSFPVLLAMVGASHFFGLGDFIRDDSKATIYLIVGLIVITVLELNALGKISGRGSTGLNWMYETHKNAIYTGIGLVVFFWLFSEIFLKV